MAIEDFERNLRRFRKLYPVKTICMHGSPLSKWDNRDLWKKYNYRDFGIIAEPYFDLDFAEVFYLTDTGRRWDGDSVSVRDKVLKKEKEVEKLRRLEDGKVKERDGWMNRMDGWGKTPRLNTLEGDTVQRGKEFGDLRFRHTWDIINRYVGINKR